MPPYALPGNKTQSGIKSRSSTGGSASTYNELRFEDKSGSEQVVLHAQKDLLVEVGHNGTLTVTQDQSTTISGNLATTVKKDETRTLQGARTTTVTKDDSTTVTKNYTLTADKITLTAGPASIEINSNGEITLTGTKITLSGQQEVDVSALKISVSASTELQLASQVTLGVQGAKTSVQGTMLSLSGSATTQISGGMITIG
jgi:type VI secretion system secreted protein VgrG